VRQAIKITNFDDFELLRPAFPHFCTCNVEIWLKRTDLGIPQRLKILSELLNRLYDLLFLHCLGGDTF